MSMETFERMESEVRGYCRSWPVVFEKSSEAHLWDEHGNKYIDLFAGAGVLNYGHNNPRIKGALLDYLADDNIIHGLDMATTAKEKFLLTFEELILKPRGMDYKVQFPGPTGTNAVEAALKLARKVTGKELVLGFTNAFHGMTLGSLSVTGNEMKRRGAGVHLHHTVSMPYHGFFGEDVDTIDYLEGFLNASGSGVDQLAAVIVETVQAEGGLHTASSEWLQRLETVCHEHGALLIVDDIQAGCGRTGTFFSFEKAGIEPDIITLSKSLSGIGLPMAITLMKPAHDLWDPGEHNGTFRGNNSAFTTATAALEAYWRDEALTREVHRKAEKISAYLDQLIEDFPQAKGTRRGRGMLQGVFCDVEGLASEVCKQAFQRGVVMETSGPESEVFKLLAPLTIDDETLDEALNIIRESVAAALQKQAAPVRQLVGASIGGNGQ
jgi:diaminobutyrate-2-oxoglutarate transaminase